MPKTPQHNYIAENFPDQKHKFVGDDFIIMLSLSCHLCSLAANVVFALCSCCLPTQIHRNVLRSVTHNRGFVFRIGRCASTIRIWNKVNYEKHVMACCAMSHSTNVVLWFTPRHPCSMASFSSSICVFSELCTQEKWSFCKSISLLPWVKVKHSWEKWNNVWRSPLHFWNWFNSRMSQIVFWVDLSGPIFSICSFTK